VVDEAGATWPSRPEGDRNRCRRPHACSDAPRQSLPLSNVCVVTGGSSGIGAAIARALVERDRQVVLLARSEERLRAVAEQLGAEYEVCDVSNRDDVERVAAAVTERHPRIGLLVNSAGVPGRADFTTIEPERLEEVMRINYLGSVWCLRAFLPALEAADRADVVNIVSVAGSVSFASGGPYAASKHAQLAFSRATAAELHTRGIHVHTVNPGFVETEGFPQERLGNGLLRRLVIEPEDVARHVLKVIDRDRRETFVPAWYRVAAVAQGLVPGLVARFAGRRVYRSRR
jgi:short-subunit dehydrogenase